MGDSLEPADFLATALRQSRAAVADDGFSARVARRVAVVQRRKKLARGVRALCAVFTATAVLFLLGMLTGYLAAAYEKAPKSLEVNVSHRSEIFSALAHAGMTPLLLVLGAAVVIIFIAIDAADRDTPLRF